MLVHHMHVVPMQGIRSLEDGGNTVVTVNGHVGARNLRSSGRAAITLNC